MPASRKAIVIGAGIGGLAAAISLRQAGVEVELYERATSLRDVGAGISMWANAIQALERLGLGNALRAASIPYAIDGLRTSDGAVLTSVSMTTLKRTIGVPIVVLHRAELLRMLLDAFGSKHVHLGAQCSDFQQDAAGVCVQFQDGYHARADFLVGADGLHSVVRARLHGDQPPRYAGCTAWRTVVTFDAQAIRATESWGYGSVFGQVPMSDNRVYWYATKNGPEEQHYANEKDELLRLFSAWHAPIRELIEAADESAILRNGIYDRPCLKAWGKGLATLLGDAAHPMTPYLGQGGCQALEDAVVLGQCIRETSAIDRALRNYEVHRIRRTNAIVKRSRLIGRIAQLENPIAVQLRNAAFKLVSPNLQARQLARIIGHPF